MLKSVMFSTRAQNAVHDSFEASVTQGLVPLFMLYKAFPIWALQRLNRWKCLYRHEDKDGKGFKPCIRSYGAYLKLVVSSEGPCVARAAAVKCISSPVQ